MQTLHLHIQINLHPKMYLHSLFTYLSKFTQIVTYLLVFIIEIYTF